MNTGGMNGWKRWRYRRREVTLQGVPVALATWEDLIAACVRTGHDEDAMLLRCVLRNQSAYAERLARHGRIECAIADYVQALTVGQAERAATLREALTAAGAVLVLHEDGAVEWANPLFGPAAPVHDGPAQHALQVRMDARIG